MTVSEPQTDLGRIIEQAERIEREALLDLHASAEAPLADALGLKLRELDTALMSQSSEDRSILLNRVLGLGVLKPASLASVEEIRRFYQQAGIDHFYVHYCPDAEPPDLPAWLQTAGLKPYRRWMKFRRDAAEPFEIKTDLRVEQVGPAQREDFGRIVAEGFDLTLSGGQLVSRLIGRPGWRLYMSFDGDEPLGVAAMYWEGDIAWFDWATTLAHGRGRGSQQALLAQRIADARSMGCQTLYAATGEAVPGDPQHSYHNLQKAGFKEAYSRDNYVPAD